MLRWITTTALALAAAALFVLAASVLLWTFLLGTAHVGRPALWTLIPLILFLVAVAARANRVVCRSEVGPRDALRELTLGALGVSAGVVVWVFGFQPPLPRNESAVISDIRSVISAQAGYESTNYGYFEGRFECLANPAECLPGYPPTAPTFLDQAIASLQARKGYDRFAHPGPTPAELQPKASRTSVESYAITAVPSAPGRSGVRAFCGDTTGRVCATRDGTPPVVEDGFCVVDDPARPTREALWYEGWVGRLPDPCMSLD